MPVTSQDLDVHNALLIVRKVFSQVALWKTNKISTDNLRRQSWQLLWTCVRHWIYYSQYFVPLLFWGNPNIPVSLGIYHHRPRGDNRLMGDFVPHDLLKIFHPQRGQGASQIYERALSDGPRCHMGKFETYLFTSSFQSGGKLMPGRGQAAQKMANSPALTSFVLFPLWPYLAHFNFFIHLHKCIIRRNSLYKSATSAGAIGIVKRRRRW